MTDTPSEHETALRKRAETIARGVWDARASTGTDTLSALVDIVFRELAADEVRRVPLERKSGPVIPPAIGQNNPRESFYGNCGDPFKGVRRRSFTGREIMASAAPDMIYTLPSAKDVPVGTVIRIENGPSWMLEAPKCMCSTCQYERAMFGIAKTAHDA